MEATYAALGSRLAPVTVRPSTVEVRTGRPAKMTDDQRYAYDMRTRCGLRLALAAVCFLVMACGMIGHAIAGGTTYTLDHPESAPVENVQTMTIEEG